MPHTLHIEAPPTHCPQCKTEYENVQHPMKPPGVSIMRVCKCVPVTTTVNGGSVTVLVPPDQPVGPSSPA